ncbi:unknown protein [Simkania negevensis Z]|uniref:Uncharacterized protein n=1 Tax=Simkania negevensis (strain ATCC VR-1471 / DSM 27360 / Z) TaxID=331113 RepID=F8L5G3_SIMNZ|nr:unknown protein [Simkania negevensis Z]
MNTLKKEVFQAEKKIATKNSSFLDFLFGVNPLIRDLSLRNHFQL